MTYPPKKASLLELYEGTYSSGVPAKRIEAIKLNDSQVNWTYKINLFKGQKYYFVKLVMNNGARA